MVYCKVQYWDQYYFYFMTYKPGNFTLLHHFADDTNFLYASHSLKKLNKTINFDLSNLVQSLRVNRISLNMNKTELVILDHQKNKSTQI